MTTKPDLNTMDMRERLMIAQALVVAMGTLKEVPMPYREVSNITDMESVLDFYFGDLWSVAEMMVEGHHDMLERINTGQLNTNQENN
tara:strand:+ start:1267 stop:1527 length:261 start_codon:yes stop_codon:yes gene_type:complete